jgi:hypothetical protein
MSANETKVRIEILTTDLGLHEPDATGLPGRVQAARVLVTAGEESRTHLIVWSADSATPLPLDERVAKPFALGWDESPAIVVKFTAGPTFVVDPVFDGRAWSTVRQANCSSLG